MPNAESAELSQAQSTFTSVLIAPAQCSNYPGHGAAYITPFHALKASSAGAPVVTAQMYTPAAIRAASRLGQIRAHANRGPPAEYIG